MGKNIKIILTYIVNITSGAIWGVVSTVWLGYSIITLGNMIEEPGSYDYYAEGESMRWIGFVGCLLYFIVLSIIVSCLRKKEHIYFG